MNKVISAFFIILILIIMYFQLIIYKLEIRIEALEEGAIIVDSIEFPIDWKSIDWEIPSWSIGNR